MLASVHHAVFHAVNDRARTQEEQGLEEGVGHQVKDSRSISTDAKSGNHVTELRDGGIGQDTLDVILGQGNGGREERCASANGSHDGHGGGQGQAGFPAGGNQREEAGRQINTRRDHCGGMDHCRDGGGAFHGIGKPDVQRELGGLAHHADKQQQANQTSPGKAQDR